MAEPNARARARVRARACTRARARHWPVLSLTCTVHAPQPPTLALAARQVKAYPPRRGGGVGAFLCGLEPGEPAYLKLKPPRLIKGVTDVSQLGLRHLGLVGGGTGLAPLLQARGYSGFGSAAQVTLVAQ